MPASRLTDRSKGQGRPLGLLGAWLAMAESFPNSAEHKAAISSITREDRVQARGNLKEIRAAASLFDLERDQSESEEEEPEAVP